MQNLGDLRREYSKASLDLTTIEKDPIKQFNLWFKEALTSEAIEPNAMNLSTINENGRPASRIVL
jgi:pyridoxamine 5'-phosphate oxidase